MKFVVALPLLATLASKVIAAPAQVTSVVYVTASAEVVTQTVLPTESTETETATASTDYETDSTPTTTEDSGSGSVGVVVSQYVEISGDCTSTYETTYTTTYGAATTETSEGTTWTSASTSSTAYATTESETAAATTTVLSSTESTTATSTTSTSSSTSSGDFQDAILNQHNLKRVLHAVVDLTWNETLEEYAQAYADKYDCSGTLTHSGGPYGENLGLGYTTTGVVDAWYDEISDYNSADPVASHYTQVVWKATTQVGCAKKYCDSYWGQYTICSYYTPGNVIGYFSENVLPLV